MSRHIKRLAAPKTWKIKRKESKFIIKPNPGPHSAEHSLPLLVIVRDILGYAKNSREARKIIKEGRIVIDRRIRKDPKFPVGLMDIVEIPDAQDYRITLFDKKGRITLVRIEKKFTKFKLCKIVDKSFVKGGKMQLHLHDGRNMLVENDIYKTKDTIVLNLDENKIENHFRYKPGSLVYIIGGSHVGEVARIRNIEIIRSPYPNKVILENSEKFETIEDYIFVIGDKSPFLDVFEVNK